jgi:alkanesulfonate monooxygenase SsuD/methylene tetrahydromethanopterin reductase-like flavin-dependent oxidoreductase (luciferase family)
MLPAIANTDEDRADPQRLLRVARLAEQAGFDGVYVGDHLLHPNPLLESLVTLGAVAATTERISLGTCVMLMGLRDPPWLAKQLGTLAAFAPGRVRIGVGVGGEYAPEFEAAGVPLSDRGRRMEEVLTRVRGLLSGEAPVADPQGMGLRPLPAEPIPFLLAGWKEVALARAARLADGWIGYLLAPDSFARRRQFLLEQGAGDAFVNGMLLPIHPDAQADGARARAAQAWARITRNDAVFPEKLFVAGPPAAIAEQLHAYWALGCGEMVLSLAEQGAGYEAQIALLAEQVLPGVWEFGG